MVSGRSYGLTAYAGTFSRKRIATTCPARTNASTGVTSPSTVMPPFHLADFIAV